MKGKIIDSDYVPGFESWVEKQTKYGSFFGVVHLDDEDLDIDNSFDGCRIAEFDADTKAYKEKAKWLRQRAIGARTIYNNIINSHTDEEIWKNGIIISQIEKQIDYMFKEADKAKEYYQRRLDYRPIFIENLLKKRREAQERYKKNDKE